MKRNNLFKAIGVVTVVMIMGLGANAFAYRGMGGGKDGGYGCNGNGMQRGGGYRCGASADFSEEDINQMKQLRQSFFKETKGTRNALYAKELALKAELAKEAPDAKVADDLQGEISALRSDLGKKHLDHVLSMRKINPNAGRGFGCQGGRAGGTGGHGMKGNCWR